MDEILRFDNLIGRPPGRYLRIGTKLSKGIRDVQLQIPVYAEQWQQANADAVNGVGPIWVVLGDSMAQGIGGSDYTRGWAGQLQDKFRANGLNYRLINLSISGARIEDVLARQLPAMEALPELPALVTVMIGSNNLARKAYRERGAMDFAAVLARLPQGSVVANLPGDGAMQVAIANQLIAAENAGQVRIADMRSGSGLRDWRGKLASDHFHPNDAGYAVLAQNFARALGVD